MPFKTGNASIRDRTHEFLGIAERVKKSYSGPSSSGSKPEVPPRSAVAMQSDFNRRASKIGYGIHQTSQKLSKLAKCEYDSLVFYCFYFWVTCGSRRDIPNWSSPCRFVSAKLNSNWLIILIEIVGRNVQQMAGSCFVVISVVDISLLDVFGVMWVWTELGMIECHLVFICLHTKW